MKKILAVLLALMLALSFVSCAQKPAESQAPATENKNSAAPAAEGNIKIGLYGPLTGPNTMNGLAMVQGAELAIKEINEAGGLLGRQLELIALDDKSNAEQAVKD
ncbi:MAG: ABC transporter substrate-binding protein, partial [Angelakisella sp.]